MGILNTILRGVTWWNSQTLNTQFYTWRKGEKVGEDDQGNVFYQSKEGRRWVIFHGEAEASRVSPEWHGWLHYTFDEPPTDAPLKRQEWETDHTPNMTGTVFAYRPKGTLREGGERREADADYEAWDPNA